MTADCNPVSRQLNGIRETLAAWLRRRQMTPPTVCILLQWLHRHDAVGNHTLVMGRMLAAHGYRVRIMAFNADPGMEQHLAAHAELERLTATDVVIIQYAGYTEWLHRLALLPCRTLLYYHNTTPGRFFRGAGTTMADDLEADGDRLRPFLERFSNLVAVSRYNADTLAALTSRPISVVPILLAEPSRELPAAPRMPVRESIILSVGKFAAHKNQLEAIACFREYAARVGCRATLVFIGTLQFPGTPADYGCACREAARGLGASVMFTGLASETEKTAWLRRAHLLVSTSLHEGFCIPIVEAMRYRVPIVAVAAGAVEETLGDGGIVVPPDNRETFVQAMLQLTHDRKKRAQVVARQQALLRARYAPDVVARQWLALLAEA